MSKSQSIDYPFFEALETRRSIHQLSNSSPIPDSRVHEIVLFALKHCPSAFNVQSARAVILLGANHQKLWDFGAQTISEVVPHIIPQHVYDNVLGPKIKGLRNAYGSVLWFEDQDKIQGLMTKNPAVTNVIPEWSDHSSGMHQYVVWTALSNEGLGCNLQHYNYSQKFTDLVKNEWDIPSTWALKAQLVFGTPISGPDREKTWDEEELRSRLRVVK